MATATQDYGDAFHEPATRTVTLELPNLRNAEVALEYSRQRRVILAASSRQLHELGFWESAQTDEGWV